MSPTITIALLWLGFAGTHMVLSSVRLRPRLVARLGTGPFQGLYSVLALVFFIPLVWVYFDHKHAGPRLWSIAIGPPLRWSIYLAMGVALTVMVAGLVRPSPAGLVAGDPTPRGVYRITRHPIFMGLAIFGLVHLLPNGSTADIVFFGGFPLYALAGCRHQDQRKLTTASPGFRAFYEGTPFLPFTGPETLRGLREMPPLVVAGGVLVTIIIRHFHTSWFGG